MHQFAGRVRSITTAGALLTALVATVPGCSDVPIDPETRTIVHNDSLPTRPIDIGNTRSDSAMRQPSPKLAVLAFDLDGNAKKDSVVLSVDVLRARAALEPGPGGTRMAVIDFDLVIRIPDDALKGSDLHGIRRIGVRVPEVRFPLASLPESFELKEDPIEGRGAEIFYRHPGSPPNMPVQRLPTGRVDGPRKDIGELRVLGIDMRQRAIYAVMAAKFSRIDPPGRPLEIKRLWMAIGF